LLMNTAFNKKYVSRYKTAYHMATPLPSHMRHEGEETIEI